LILEKEKDGIEKKKKEKEILSKYQKQFAIKYI
jgi:hypothetical protein